MISVQSHYSATFLVADRIPCVLICFLLTVIITPFVNCTPCPISFVLLGDLPPCLMYPIRLSPLVPSIGNKYMVSSHKLLMSCILQPILCSRSSYNVLPRDERASIPKIISCDIFPTSVNGLHRMINHVVGKVVC